MSISIELIKQLLKSDLPGEEAHLAMSPMGRKKSSQAIKQVTNYRESAVALVLFETEETIKSVLIQRPIYKGSHSGQVCLPGGKREEFETSLDQTAVRECVEETGLITEHLDLLGSLTPVFIPVSNHHVHPYIFHYTETPEFFPDEREVAEILPFNVMDILVNENIKTTDIRITQERILRDVPYFDIREKIVWGATAIILNEFRVLCERHFD